MKKSVLKLILMSLTSLSLSGQTAQFGWAGQYAEVSGGTSEITDMIWKSPGVGGNIYSCGYFTGTVDFDMQAGTTTLTSNGGSDVFISCQRDDGTFLWAVSIGGTGNDSAWTIIEGTDDWLYVGGSFSSTVDFDPGAGTLNLTSSGGGDAFVLKIEPTAGNIDWALNIAEGSGNASTKGLYMLPDSTIYAAGEFDSTADLNSGNSTTLFTSAGASDVFVSIFNSDASYRRSSVFPGNGVDLAYDIVAEDDIVVVNGYFADSIDADPTNGTAMHAASPGGSMFIARIDSTGAYGTSGQLETARKVCMYYYEGVYRIALAGSYLDSIDMQLAPSVTYIYSEHPGTYEGFVILCSVYLGFNIDQFSFGGNDDDFVSAIGGYYSDVIIAGNTTSTLFDADITSDSFMIPASGDDIFAFSFHNINYTLNNSGTARNLSSNRSVRASDAVYGPSGVELFLAGGFNLSPNFDPIGTYNLTTLNQDAYLLQWTACAALNVGTSFQSCDTIFVFNNHTYSVPGTYSDTLTTVCGSDSIVTFNVTQIINDTSVTVSGFSLTSNQSAVNYQWVDCNNNYAIIAGATLQNFTPSTDGSYAVIVSSGNCSDTSNCHTILGIGISESDSPNLFVSPNPFNDVITITNTEPGTVIILLNMLGEVVKTDQAQATSLVMDTKDLPAGTYILQSERSGKRTSTRLIK